MLISGVTEPQRSSWDVKSARCRVRNSQSSVKRIDADINDKHRFDTDVDVSCSSIRKRHRRRTHCEWVAEYMYIRLGMFRCNYALVNVKRAPELHNVDSAIPLRDSDSRAFGRAVRLRQTRRRVGRHRHQRVTRCYDSVPFAVGGVVARPQPFHLVVVTVTKSITPSTPAETSSSKR